MEDNNEAMKASNGAMEASKWSREAQHVEQWGHGLFVDQWLKIRITMMRNRIWIRIKEKSRIRFPTNVMWICNTADLYTQIDTRLYSWEIIQYSTVLSDP
jgi:hypothetical protein